MAKKDIKVAAWSFDRLGLMEKVGEKETWYNVPDNLFEADRQIIKDRMKNLDKGVSVIKVDLNDEGKYIGFEFVSGERKGETDNPKVINIKGKDHVTYRGLLELAHKNGLQSFEILEQHINEDMTKAWVKVRVHVRKEKKDMFFDGIGSSTPDNTTDLTKLHPIEMAHTRAKGRALRDFLNIGEAMLEELKEEPKEEKPEHQFGPKEEPKQGTLGAGKK